MSNSRDYKGSFKKLTGPKRESDEDIARGLGVTVEFYRERKALLMRQVEEVNRLLRKTAEVETKWR